MDYDPLNRFGAGILDDPEAGVLRLVVNHPIAEYIRQAATAVRSHASPEVRDEIAAFLTQAGADRELDGGYPPNDPVGEAGAAALYALEENFETALVRAGQAAFAFSVAVPTGESLREEHRFTKGGGQEFPFTAGKEASIKLRAHHLSRLQRALDEPNQPVSREEGEDLDEYSERIDVEIAELLRRALG